MVAAAAAAVLVTAVMAIAASVAQATSGHGAHNGLSRQSSAQTMLVRPGDSLWSVAVRADPNADARVVIQEMIRLNHLPGTLIYPGEQLRVPDG